jgi:hypothetical protein
MNPPSAALGRSACGDIGEQSQQKDAVESVD